MPDASVDPVHGPGRQAVMPPPVDTAGKRQRHRMPGGRHRAAMGTGLGVALGVVLHLVTRATRATQPTRRVDRA